MPRRKGDMQTKKASTVKTSQKEMVLKALTDPKFRKMLQAEPEKLLNKRTIDVATQKEIAVTLSLVKGIEAQISAVADELLCAYNPPPDGKQYA
jgi:hypothetical protein